MQCFRCSKVGLAMFTVHPKETDSAGANVCGACLVGEYVPVFRSSRQRWSLAQVTQFQSQKPIRQFCLLFGTLGSDVEWLDIDPQPFIAYAKHHREATGTVVRPSTPDYIADDDPLPFQRDSAVQRSLAYDPAPRMPLPPLNEFVKQPRSVKFPSLQTNSHRFVVSPTGNSTVTTPRLWSIDEDRLLMNAIVRFREPVRWSKLAEHVPNRTGKQCRERYCNHLMATLNRSEWTPVDDALLFYLYKRIGPKWTAIAVLLRRRNNNSTKNRFHHIRRRLAKDSAKAQGVESPRAVDVLRRLPEMVSSTMGATPEVARVLSCTIESKQFLPTILREWAHVFTLSDAVETASCRRCGLMVPSQQTGRKLCPTRGWCESCVSTPPYVCDDILRLAHVVVSHSEVTVDASTEAISG